MNSKLLRLNSAFVQAIALESKDPCWESTLSRSFPGKFWEFLKQKTQAGGTRLAGLGSLLQILGYFLVLAIVVALGLPQLAGDKEGFALLILSAGALRLLGTIAGGKESYRPTAIDALVLAFLGINVIATFASHYFATSLLGLAKVIVYIAAYFVFVSALGHSRKRLSWTLSLLLLTGLLVSLYGLYQYKIGVAPLATWEDPTVESKGTRIFSTLGNPNLLAAYLIPMIPLSLGAAMALAAARRWFFSLPVFAVAGIISVATLLTGSRGAYAGIAAALGSFLLVSAIYSWKSYPKSRPAILLLAIALPILLFLGLHKVPSFEQRFISIFKGSEHSSNAFRMMVWRASWRMFQDSWWFGIGPGNKTFVLAYGLYMTSGYDALGTYSVPLEIAVETGIFGLLIFAGLVLATLCRAHIGFWQAADGYQRWFSLALASALLGMMAHGAVDTVFYRPQVQLIFWLVIAAEVSLCRRVAPVEDKPALR